jgi:hypothetical protein
MPTPRLLMDNDALLKAAHWDLLDVVPTMVGGTWADTACLPTFPPRVHRAEAKLFADASVAKALEVRLALTVQLPDPDVTVLSALQGESGIDAGELLLFGALAATPGTVLLTGDKRALRAVALTGTLSRYQNRVMCVEQLLSQALDQLGAQTLQARVRRWTPRDQTALAIFGRQGDKSEADLREGLRSYLHSLEGETSGLLVRGFGL